MLHSPKSQFVLASLVCLVGAGWVYGATLAPTVQGFDSAELTVGAYTLGLVHPTGYPLYMLIGHWASHWPIGEVGFRLNLLSALLGALSVWLFFVLLHAQSKSTLTALAGAALFGLAPQVWAQSTRAEVYTLQSLLVVCILLTWLAAQQQNKPALALLSFGLLGVAGTNHATSIWLGLALLAGTNWRNARWRSYSLAGMALGAGSALLLYLYFPWRAAQLLLINYIQDYFGRDPRRLADLFWLVSGQGFHCSVAPAWSLSGLVAQLARFGVFIWDGTLGLAPLLGIWGWNILRTTAPRWNRLLSVFFLGNVAFFVIYQVVDKEAMFLSVYLILDLWIAQGVLGLVGWLHQRLPGLGHAQIHLLANLALLTVLAVGAALDWPALDQSQDRTVHQYATQVLQELPPHTILVNHWVTASVFDYLRIVEALRPDVSSFNLDFYFLGLQQDCQIDGEAEDQAAWFGWLNTKLHDQTPLCFIEPLPPIPDTYVWEKQGACWSLTAAR